MAAPDELRFQELEAAAELLAATPDAVTPRAGEERPSPSPEGEPGDDADTAELLGEQRQPRSFWTFEYYQAFFDVDTQQVLERIKGSVTPLPGKNFVRHRLRNNPDLYGPFWICATLALALALSGNLSHLAEKRTAPGYRYSPQFHNVTIAATLIYCYAGLVPLALWGFLRWRRSHGALGLLETLCVYGYSLSAYVPTAVLWLIPATWLQWLLLGVAALLSASVLALTFWPLARPEGRATALALVATVTSLHALLAVGCKLYFFQRPPNAGPVAAATAAAEGLRAPAANVSLPGAHPTR
ncbi:LOW QUALITY PROTEIN: protein YIPF2 [Rissa tridactyla]|uniref:LOW QUALITY PROTEIN: protein YIPF2 n=1 Tax=Rissa tridactyla TaxID=75485 RepID=UPI0023BAD46B|nr:LOW QUALITY PROTEIN: protein YIPF2 [Rissa tridactyla]